MDSKVTLKSIFVLNKGELSAKLDGLFLPKDSQQVQNVVTDFLDNMFENDGQFRQTLTESEDFLLQASLRLLQAQQNIALEFAKASKDAIQQNGICRNITQSQKSPTSSMYISAAGAGVGALAGGFLGTWAAVAGAIAGTALVIYCSTRPSNNSSMSNAGLSSPSINVSSFSNIIENICDSIDGVIDTYRVQVKRIANSYEQREKPSLLNTYSMLIEQIANVIKFSKDINIVIPSNLKSAIYILEETLENYDLKYDNGRIVTV